MQEEKTGINKISDDTLADYTVHVVQNIPGVINLSVGLSENLPKNIFGKVFNGKGVRICHTDDGLVIDIYVIVEFKAKIPQLAWEIQGIVKDKISKEIVEKIKEINIHVQGVDFPKKENN